MFGRTFLRNSEIPCRDMFKNISCLIKITLVTAILSVVLYTVSISTCHYHYTKSIADYGGAKSENMCTEDTVGPWCSCIRPCTEKQYSCNRINLEDKEKFVYFARIVEILGLLLDFAAIGLLLIWLNRRNENKVFIASGIIFVIAGMLAMTGGYCFILAMRSHIHWTPSTGVHLHLVDQHVGWSFVFNMITGVLCFVPSIFMCFGYMNNTLVNEVN